MTFEQYLEEKFAAQHCVPDDDMPDAFDRWVENLEEGQWIEFANEYGDICRKDGMIAIAKQDFSLLGRVL
jgi:hypothetical protein